MSSAAGRMKVSRRAAVVVLVAIAVVAAWLLVFFLPQTHKLQALEARRRTLQAAVAADQARLQVVKAEAAHVTQIKAMQTRLDKYAPGSEDLYTYIHTISAAAKRAGVTITSLSPSGLVAVTGGQYSAIPISASIKGTYDHVLAFIKGLYNLPRLTDINSVSVTGGGPGSNRSSSLSVSLQLAIFTSQKPTGAGS